MAQLDPKDVTIAILTNMIRLIGAELVAGRHRDDVATFERAVRAKLASTPFPIDPCESTEAGLELAKRCIEQALTEIRSQADDVKSASSGDNHEDIAIDDQVKPTLQ